MYERRASRYVAGSSGLRRTIQTKTQNSHRSAVPVMQSATSQSPGTASVQTREHERGTDARIIRRSQAVGRGSRHKGRVGRREPDHAGPCEELFEPPCSEGRAVGTRQRLELRASLSEARPRRDLVGARARARARARAWARITVTVTIRVTVRVTVRVTAAPRPPRPSKPRARDRAAPPG